jgi:single-strand DNA-binding protein
VAGGVNKVILVGNLGSDPELKYTPSGVAVCEFSIATSESWTDKQDGSKKEETEWHNIKVWNKLAEICGKYLVKGRQVFVEGKLETRSWDDEKAGVKRYKTEIVARDVQFLGGKPGNDGGQGQNQAPPSSGGGGGYGGGGGGGSRSVDEDIPF